MLPRDRYYYEFTMQRRTLGQKLVTYRNGHLLTLYPSHAT